MYDATHLFGAPPDGQTTLFEQGNRRMTFEAPPEPFIKSNNNEQKHTPHEPLNNKCFFTKSKEVWVTANLHQNIMGFRGFASSRISILRDAIPRPIGNFPESLIQAILVGIMLVGRVGVQDS